MWRPMVARSKNALTDGVNEPVPAEYWLQCYVHCGRTCDHGGSTMSRSGVLRNGRYRLPGLEALGAKFPYWLSQPATNTGGTWAGLVANRTLSKNGLSGPSLISPRLDLCSGQPHARFRERKLSCAPSIKDQTSRGGVSSFTCSYNGI